MNKIGNVWPTWMGFEGFHFLGKNTELVWIEKKVSFFQFLQFPSI